MIGVIYSLHSRHALSEQHLIESLRLNPSNNPAWTQLGITYAAQGKYRDAIASFSKALVLDPKNTQTLNNLGNVYRELGNYKDAESCYAACLRYDSKNYIAMNNIANIYLTQCRYDKAQAYYKNAIRQNKKYFDAYFNLGSTYQSQGDHKQALKYYRLAQKIRPDDIHPQAAIASSYEKQGNYDKALEYITPLLGRNIISPDIADIYSKICIKNKQYEKGIDIVKKCLADRVGPIHEQELRFALGDIYDKQGSYDEAFAEYSRANNMRPYQYDASRTEHSFDQIKEIFSDIEKNGVQLPKSFSELPLFILGMPRSGTSLIEQILSSHRKVCGGGELPYIPELAEKIKSETAAHIHYPECIRFLDKVQADSLANEYLSLLKKHCKDSEYITDKLPHNFIYVGFIRMLFENSKIIHCIRNPLDVCLSIYFHNFNQNHPYSDNLRNLGHYYNQYRKLVEFWHELFPGFIVDVSYEDLLKDTEPNVRKLLEKTGLEWDDNCMKFYQNKRTVNTPSYAQVTQPIYTSSVQRWRNYEKHIGALMDSIDDHYLRD